VWAAALGPEFAARAALVVRPLSCKATFEFGDATATKLLMLPLFSGCTNWLMLEKGKGKKHAAGVLVASVATAVDLGGEEGGAPRPSAPTAVS
jgi:hypothetical protein